MNKAISLLFIIVGIVVSGHPLWAKQKIISPSIASSRKGERVERGGCIQKNMLRDFKNRAKRHDLVALRALREYYGRGCAPNDIDDSKLLFYSKKAAEVGTSADITIYASDLDGFKGPATAFPMYLSAATRGDIDAIEWIASAYMRGVGTKKNYDKAKLWSTLAAKRGCSISMTDLAYLLTEGSGTLNNEKALAWLLVEQKILSGFGVDYQSERAKKLMAQLKTEVPPYLDSTVKLLREDYEYDVGQLKCK